MRGIPTTFWGKLSSSGSERQWHPLSSHCADVAACCERLLQGTLLRRRLAAWGGLEDLDDSQIARLGVLAAFRRGTLDALKEPVRTRAAVDDRPGHGHGHGASRAVHQRDDSIRRQHRQPVAAPAPDSPLPELPTVAES